MEQSVETEPGQWPAKVTVAVGAARYSEMEHKKLSWDDPKYLLSSSTKTLPVFHKYQLSFLAPD